MKNLFTYGLFATVLLLNISCKKDTVDYVDPHPPATAAKIKTVNFGTYERTAIYDSLGRLATANFSTGAKTEITYGATEVTSNSYNNSGGLSQKDIYLLNAGGLIGSATNSNNLPSVFYYTYDGEGYLINDTYFTNGVLKRTRFYVYTNGNLVYDSTAEGANWSTNKYEYYSDVISTTEVANHGNSIYGKGNINALKKVVTTYAGVTPATKEYAYPEKDAKGRITKTSFSLNGATPVVYQYTYYD